MIRRLRTRLFVRSLENRITPATILVTNNLDTVAVDGTVSLREALDSINVGSNINADVTATGSGYGTSDIVDFNAALIGPITLPSGQLTVSKSVFIQGPGAAKLTVQNTQAFATTARVFNITAGMVAITGLTVTGGNTFQSGGGIATVSSTTLTDVVVTGNKSNFGGGGIAVYGSGSTLTLNACIVSNNKATDGSARGGGVGVFGNGNHNLIFSDTTVVDNSAGSNGGGIHFTIGGTLAMERSTVSGNKSNTVTAGVGGGGIYLFNTPTIIRNSTISGNSTNSGGKDSRGGGIAVHYGTVLIQNSTIAFNNAGTKSGGGLACIYGSESVTLVSTIISSNTATTGPDVSGKITTANVSLISNGAGLTITTNNGTQVGVDPLLGPLGNTLGGLTKYHVPGAGSPAINMGTNTAGLFTDQRGPGFDRTEGIKPDVGSFETGNPLPPSATSTAPDVITAGGVDQVVTVVYTDGNGSQLINFSKLGTGDITVTGPGGFAATPTLVSTAPGTDAKTITATYKFAAPGGAFDAADNGVFTINLVGNEVFDKDVPTPIAVPPQALGTFQVAIATTFVVNAANDESVDTDGKTSLREALAASNADATTIDTITFDATIFGSAQTITLTQGEFKVNSAVIVTGPTSGVTIDAVDKSRHFNIDAAGKSAQAVSLSGLTLTNGNSGSGHGGSILNVDEDLALSRVTVQNSTTTGHGGGIIVLSLSGSLNIADSALKNNSATTGGGIRATNLTIARSTVSGNFSNLRGGGIYMRYGGGTLTMTDSTVSGNQDLSASGTGGGVSLWQTVATITQSTIAGNASASAGGGIVAFSGSILTVNNSTVAFNVAFGNGNGGGGIYNFGSSTINLDSTVVSDNQSDFGGPDIGGAVTANFSLISKTAGASITGGNNVLGVSAKLNFLANNGGPTKTLHPAAGSPVIGAGSNPAGLAADQRGTPFARNVNGAVDIGAVEVQQVQLVVTNNADSGPGSLRQAVLDANVNPGTDTIIFESVFFSSPRTITLTTGELGISDSVNVIGPGAALATVSGNNVSRVFYIYGTALLDVTLSGLTITKSVATAAGIESDGENLTVQKCVITGNGGGISVDAPGFLTLTDSQVTNNVAGIAGFGGVQSAGGAIILRSTISGNTGGTLGTLVCLDGLTLEDSTVAGNSTAGPGGGLFLIQTVSSTWLIRNSTISGNTSAKSGGAIALGYNAMYGFNGTLTVRNSTITANKATTGAGGGIARIFGTGTISLESSIVSGNINSGAPDLYSSGTVNAKTSLLGSSYGVNTLNGDVFTNANIGTNPLLGALANNGGPTLTHALLAGSPAINNGSNPGALSLDQRGVGFARSVNITDIGAFEVQAAATKVSTVVINSGAAQRSRVTSLTVTFDSAVTLPANPVDAFQLKRQSDNAPVALSASVTGNSVTLTFAGGPVNFGSLADGRYTLTVLAAQVTAGNFDGNGDGTPGDDFVLTGNPTTTPKLFRLFGDLDGDGTVAANDFIQFRLALGGSNPIFDFDGDGAVAASDFIQFRLRFGGSI